MAEALQDETAAGIPVFLPERTRVADERWYVLRTRSRQEKVLSGALAGMRINHYLPILRRMRTYGARRVEVSEPMFPGYLFLWGPRDQLYEADRTRRVAGIIEVHDQERLEWELSGIHQALSLRAPLELYPALQVGIRVVIVSGPFLGLQGLVERKPKPDRLVLQVRMLGGAVKLEIDGAAVEPIDAGEGSDRLVTPVSRRIVA